jgi:hypothetical protein
MASDSPDFYKLEVGAEYDDLFPRDFVDVMWQAFEKDKLASLTIKISKPTERIKMRVVAVQRRSPKIRGP